MEKIINNLFGFGSHLNGPFTGIPAKVLGAASKYSGAKASMSTISSTVINTALVILDTEAGKTAVNTLAIGEADDKGIVEYHREASSVVDLISYDPEDGSVVGLIYDEDSKKSEPYILQKGQRDGKAIIAAMWPTLLSDEEFEETFNAFRKEYVAGFDDIDKATQLAGILSDNVYRRIKEDSCPAHLPIDIPETGTVVKMKNASIIAGIYAPTSVDLGSFSVLDDSAAEKPTTSTVKAKKAKTVDDLNGKYPLNPARKFTEEEKMLIPTLEPWYIPSKEDFTICDTIVKTSGTAMPFRNFVFRGGAGSGKSAKSRAIAAGLGLPFGFYTCSANTEIFDLVGQVMPATKNEQNKEAAQLFDRFEKLGGVSVKNISTVLGLPSVEDVEFMPVETYESITGSKTLPDGSEPTAIETMKIWSEFMMTKCNEVLELISGKTNNKFVYTETPFIKAIKNGWVFEIQEPNVIASEGVIVGLNGLLQEGRIVLPTGEVVNRHPDSVIIFTTNVSYNGCRDMNQSVIDRGAEVFDIETPPVESMMERAMSISGYTDEVKAKEMAQIVSDIGKTMNETGIDDGVCGMRSLIAWMIKTNIGYDPYEAALTTVISKVSGDPEARGALLKRLDESSFKRISRRRGR